MPKRAERSRSERASSGGSSKPTRPTRSDPPLDDERYFVVGGRRWRKTDPAIPDTLRSELVQALMRARRQVGAAKRTGDRAQERDARSQVNDAKLALGERGPAWWEAPSSAALGARSAAAARTLLRQRGNDKTICPSDVARIVGGAAWRSRMPAVRDSLLAQVSAGELNLMQKGERVPPERARGPIRFGLRAAASVRTPGQAKARRATLKPK